MGQRLQQMLENIRDEWDHLTTWLRQEIKKSLLVHWETDEGFRHPYLTNRANRALTRSFKYTSSSATFVKTKARLLEREAPLAETFKYTHTLNENKARFANQQSQDHYQSGEDADGSVALVVNSDAVWRETASALYKNCELTHSLHQQAQELNDYWERYQEILTCVIDWREQLERLQRMEAQMEVYWTQMRAAGIIPASGSGLASGTQTSPPSALPH
ncbi:hypothetical protein Ahy_A07g034447 [Arachis hypogaea]|uniref:Uncharacterized protein n=1 Tax=Arachis hypogaea TaxID=3818 RepID=A0A445CBW3_ARAHY|nr:hypothetical protein Ahy_A07g034447 [Arachis hypogaea]